MRWATWGVWPQQRETEREPRREGAKHGRSLVRKRQRQHQERVDDANGEAKDRSERHTSHGRPSITSRFSGVIDYGPDQVDGGFLRVFGHRTERPPASRTRRYVAIRAIAAIGLRCLSSMRRSG